MRDVDEDLPCDELTELVTDYLEDALEPDERARLEAHLEVCEGCRAYLEQVRQTVLVLGHLPAEELSPASRERVLDAFRAWRDGSPSAG